MHPWAILFEQDVIIWSFGISEIEFPTQAKNLIMALQEFGQGLYGEGITMVEFSYSHYSQDYKGVFLSHTPDQLFVVNLSDSFLLLISDITAVVSIMPFIDVHPDMDDLLRGVLVAQGTNIYAHLILQAQSRNEEEEIDHLFRKVLRLAGRNDANNLIIKGNFTLSPLSIPELLLFHTFLREKFHTLSVAKNLEHWGILANNNGSEIKYFYNIDADKAILISGLLSAFIKYTQYAFGIIPTRMVFGSTDLQDIRIFASADYNMAMNNPEQLLIDPKFKKTFGLLHEEDQNIVIPYIIPFLQREATKLLQKQITGDFSKLLKLISDLRSERDSLINIKGVGPNTLEILQSLGVRNISDFIKLDKESLRKISEQSEKRNLISENKLLKWQTQGRRLMKSSKRLSL